MERFSKKRELVARLGKTLCNYASRLPLRSTSYIFRTKKLAVSADTHKHTVACIYMHNILFLLHNGYCSCFMRVANIMFLFLKVNVCTLDHVRVHKAGYKEN